jgi:reticulon-4-interacting protein 1, mitochondrial
MKAWTFSRRGHPLNTLELSTVPTPEVSSLKDDEVLVKISHASLNLFSSLLAWVVPSFVRTKPSVLEMDFSGRIVGIGKSISNVSVGDDVFGVIQGDHHLKQGRGALAEYVIASRDEVVAKPTNISFAEAAGLGTVGVTGFYLASKSGLKTGDRVLVNGGSGGAGLSTLQAVRELVGPEGTIVTTCSAKNTDLVKSFGADEVIDYTQYANLPAYLKQQHGSKPFDAILDTVGTGQSQAIYNNSPAYLAEGKPYLTIGSPMGDGLTVTNLLKNISNMLQNNAWPRVLGGTPRYWEFVDSSGAGPEVLKQLSAAIADGKHRGQIDQGGKVWGFEDAKKALERLVSRRAQGKVVVKVQEL